MKRLLVKLSIASEGATMKEKARAGICLYILSIKEILHRHITIGLEYKWLSVGSYQFVLPP